MPKVTPLPHSVPLRSSRGGLWLAAGFAFLLASGLVSAMPGAYWQGYLMAFGFSLFGLFQAQGRARRVTGVLLSGVGGGLCLQDFLVWLA